ncbi:hypothetical protein BGZ96_011558 [Linnemannia gamsii]|uniref:Uncharacterized protein n=1 Tax=Linnemannia gamsii TaxID=64522 RepID=A0ABQ7JS65_9FUNG|nr:hypothetical protein BGZ96_011558 [Linnemannia gamsii]
MLVLLIIFLDFCKNVAFLAKQVQNLSPTAITAFPDGTIRQSRKDPAYLAAQYAYTIWLVLMALKAIVGFRANLKFNLRWMGKYNALFGLDTVFEFAHTTLGVIFQDLNSMDDSEIIRHYTINFLIKWVMSEMPQLMNPEDPPMTFLRLMVPCAYSRVSSSENTRNSVANATATETTESGSGVRAGVGRAVDPRTLEEGTATTSSTLQTTTVTTATTTTAIIESR